MLHDSSDSLIFNGGRLMRSLSICSIRLPSATPPNVHDLSTRPNQDSANRVVILTGAGEAFIDRIDGEGFDFFFPAWIRQNLS